MISREVLRPATPADAPRVADILILSRAAHLPFAPMAQTPESVRAWVAQVLVPGGGVCLAELDGQPRAMGAQAMDNGLGWVEQLYVEPGYTGQGLGTSLLRRMLSDLQAAGAHAVRLWCFQANTGARRFDEGEGFVAVGYTDGLGNEERCPDVLYERSSAA
jgi:RimJ/RimL family protein N-acetyltransferase